MKLIVFACLLGAAFAAPRPQVKEALARITEWENDNIGLGKYFYHARSDDGANVVEQADLKNEGTDDEALEVEGQYSYVGDDGKMYIVTYTAGKNGYEPHGDHIPKAASVRESPPQLGIPSAALASLAG